MNQKGFTLIEIMAVMAVSGLIMAVALLSIYQIVWGAERSNDQVLALTDVHYAALWIKQDLQMSQVTDLTDGDPVPQSSVSLNWTDYTGFAPEDERNHSSTYVLSGTELLRTYDGTTRIIGRHITSIDFIQDGNVITCNITATGPGIPERTEQVGCSIVTHLRPEEAG
jgi:prepilin-type N-terminal cleavage/methylation domain-containing protein